MNTKHTPRDQRGTTMREFRILSPLTAKELPMVFISHTATEIDRIVSKSNQAFEIYRQLSGKEKSLFLKEIAVQLIAERESIISQCAKETGLPIPRLIAEFDRTIHQLHLYGDLVYEGSWVNARIDRADPLRQPIPKPDVRQMQIPLGPVGVFCASNFPLAFSVAGGDTVSALAAGCSVVVKGHSAHLGTAHVVVGAIKEAAQRMGLPEGLVELVQGMGKDVGIELVTNPAIKAIGFTGSTQGGLAISKTAAERPEPIPVYAEMGSVNPVFILPEAMQENGEGIAEGLAASATLSVGQFCTNPGLTITLAEHAGPFMKRLKTHFETVPWGTMLTLDIKKAYDEGIERILGIKGVELIASGAVTDTPFGGTAYLLHTKAETLLDNHELMEEVFGPETLVVTCTDKGQLLAVAAALHGSLTGTIHGTSKDVAEYDDLRRILEGKVGRLVFNGFPTGVEVCHSMVHGGPFPATSDAKFTSVGTMAIYRFTRPICYQSCPKDLLPKELHDDNPLGICRLIDGKFTKDILLNFKKGGNMP